MKNEIYTLIGVLSVMLKKYRCPNRGLDKEKLKIIKIICVLI